MCFDRHLMFIISKRYIVGDEEESYGRRFGVFFLLLLLHQMKTIKYSGKGHLQWKQMKIKLKTTICESIESCR